MVFPSRVFRDVIFVDDVAIGMMRGGQRVSSGRRLLLGSVTFVVLFILTPFLFSAFVQNRGLQSRAEEALVRLSDVPPSKGSPAEVSEALVRLEGLRGLLDTLGDCGTDGPPLRFGGWLGLYVGPRMPVVFQEYESRFRPPPPESGTGFGGLGFEGAAGERPIRKVITRGPTISFGPT